MSTYAATLDILDTTRRPAYIQIREELPEPSSRGVRPNKQAMFSWSERTPERGPSPAFFINTTSRTEEYLGDAPFEHFRFFSWRFSEDVSDALPGDRAITAPQRVSLRHDRWENDVTIYNGQTRAELVDMLNRAGAFFERLDGRASTRFELFFPSGTDPEFVWWVTIDVAGVDADSVVSEVTAYPIPTVQMDW